LFILTHKILGGGGLKGIGLGVGVLRLVVRIEVKGVEVAEEIEEI
jgi:hypothetical protein